MISKTIIILALVLITVAFASCTTNTFNTKNFENENISFDYPDTWKITVTQDPGDNPDTKWIISIQNPEEIAISVKIAETETPQSSSVPTSITIDNITTQEYGDNSTYKMYTFSKNNKYYQIIVYGVNIGSQNDFKEFKAQFDTILNSIHIK